MYYEPFYKRFPEIAKEETRRLLVFDDPDLPDDEYALLESYCSEPHCDCRRVFFNVFSKRRKQIVAVIAYGWESKRYYQKWLGDNNPDILSELKGPALNTASSQSELSSALLEKVKLVLKDKNYVKRLKRHYALFKKSVAMETLEESKNLPVVSKEKISRNDPCPCGSGKKYKKCCLQKDEEISLKNIFKGYNQMTAEFEGTLDERTAGEIAHDNIVLSELRRGSSIKEALDAAAEKYPEEALQYDDENIDDIRIHYNYLLNHEIIKNRMAQFSN